MSVLDGLRVIEMAGIGPIPWAGMVLADLGAEVIRIERPSALVGGVKAGPVDRGRRSLVLDLKQPAAVDIVLDLVATADVLIEGFRPGVMERLGLGPDACLARNPDLVYGRMTGWGQQGPRAGTAGHDLNFLSVTGVLAAIGPKERSVPPLNLIGDYGGGAMLLLVGVLAALWATRNGSPGQVVDAAMVDGVSLLASAVYGLAAQGLWKEEREANLLDGGAPFYRTYHTSDGEEMAVGALEPQFYAVLLDRLGLDPSGLPAQYDLRGWQTLHRKFAEAFARQSRAHWIEVFADCDACVTPVLRWSEVADDAHMRARGSVVEHEGMSQAAPGPRFGATPSAPLSGTRPAGADTEAILAELGYTQAAIVKLLAEKVAAVPSASMDG